MRHKEIPPRLRINVTNRRALELGDSGMKLARWSIYASAIENCRHAAPPLPAAWTVDEMNNAYAEDDNASSCAVASRLA
jgi:hypothetical protein